MKNYYEIIDNLVCFLISLIFFEVYVYFSKNFLFVSFSDLDVDW